MTKVEEEKDQSRRADKVIKHRAALCRLLAQSGLSAMSVYLSAFGAKRTCIGPCLCGPRSLMTQSGHRPH